jgi:hypothetical protein
VSISTGFLLCILMALFSTAACAGVEMKIVTAKGFVAFTAEENWHVQSMQSQMPIAAGIFQIPNSADVGTQDSTNLIVMFYQLDSEKGRAKFDAPVKQYGPVAPTIDSFEEWTIYRQDAKQGNTLYSIWDAKKGGVADVSVSVRLAWPHLDASSKSYAVEMDTLFRGFLKSIYGSLGPYVPRDGEVIRRPVQ